MNFWPGDWRHRARCQDVDGDLFFKPEQEQERETSQTKAAREGRALALCALCPVRARCLEWALDTGQGYGIWGGLREEQLQALRRERAMSA